ncbi:uncharacterized protein LOC112597199 [Melanaphis sacchari]|uniref:uncharacterized protein LOC112597199 n=2 Tax=Melanaphis sacchari TaxID=742174 RepID=UPI000DC14EAA|nr:uncharacterized protein LOC112597199 [Melanaphis sacchari]
MFSNGCKRKAVENLYTKPSKILRTEISENISNLQTITTDDISLVRRNIYNARRKMVPPLPKTMEELQNSISNLNLKTDLNEQFLLINDPNCHIIIFSCDTNLKVLCESEIIYMDGTFEYCPKLFTQLFSLHGLCNDHYIPLLFALLPDKKTSTYVNLFKNIIHLCNARELSLKPNLFISDFEEAIHVALRQVWDDTKIFGCRFHLTQSWYRKIQELGLSNVYQNNKTEESKWLNHTFGLPFISPNEVSNCFIEDFMSSIPNDIRFQKYADYLVDTYICEEAKFPPIIWAANIASLSLTTNACESYHSRFNSEFYHPHPTIYHFLDVLKGFQTETLIKIKSQDILLKGLKSEE